MGENVLVRLTPDDRVRAVEALCRVTGHEIPVKGRVIRVRSSAESALRDAVNLAAARGYSMAMRPETAEEIADLLDTAGEPKLAERFRRQQRRAERTNAGNWSAGELVTGLSAADATGEPTNESTTGTVEVVRKVAALNRRIGDAAKIPRRTD